MNKKHKWKKLGKIFMIIVAFAAIVGAAVYSVVKKRIDAQVVMIYEESTVQKGSLKNEVTENGSVAFGIVSDTYELDLGTTQEEDDDDDEEEEEKYLKIEEVYVAVGQRINEGDPVYSFTEDSVADVRKNLQYAKTEAQITLSQAQTSYDLGVLEASLNYDESILGQSVAESSYNNTMIRLANDMAAKTLQIEQLLVEIYQIQCDLVDEDYLEKKQSLEEAYEDAIEAAEDVSEDFVTNKVEAFENLQSAETSYEEFLQQADSSNEQIAEKMKEITKIQTQMAYTQALMEKDILQATQKLETANLEGSLAEQTKSSSLSSYETTLAKAQEELEECTQRLEEFEAFVGEGTVYAKGSGLVTTVGYEEGDSLITAGTLISYAVSDAMTIEVDVAQEDVTTMKVGDAVSIQFAAYEDVVYEGIVEAITTTATSTNSATVSYPVRILILGDTSKIYEGMTADVTFIIEEMQDVIYVPRKAIVEENGKKYVYIKNGEEYVLTAVTTGFTDGSNIEILSGLQEGDTFYIATVAAKNTSVEEEKEDVETEEMNIENMSENAEWMDKGSMSEGMNRKDGQRKTGRGNETENAVGEEMNDEKR